MEEVKIEIRDVNYVAEWSDSFGGYFRKRADAQTVAEEIQGIGESVTSREMVDYAASHPESELHKCMEWDNDIAADHWRIQQAGQIITCLHIKIIHDDKPPKKTQIRYFSMPDKKGGGYTPTEIIYKDANRYELLLEKARAEFETFRRKYQTLSELENVFRAFDEAFE